LLIKDSNQLAAFSASDGCLIREVIHPRADGTDPGLSLARATVAPGRATRPHRLDMVEVYYLVAGRGRMVIDGLSREVGPGQAIYIPAGAVQFIENIGPDELDFLCFCAPAYDPAADHPA
jgi:mannose-6-phosphate isomerase-like protein (cupin superfamily)